MSFGCCRSRPGPRACRYRPQSACHPHGATASHRPIATRGPDLMTAGGRCSPDVSPPHSTRGRRRGRCRRPSPIRLSRCRSATISRGLVSTIWIARGSRGDRERRRNQQCRNRTGCRRRPRCRRRRCARHRRCRRRRCARHRRCRRRRCADLVKDRVASRHRAMRESIVSRHRWPVRRSVARRSVAHRSPARHRPGCRSCGRRPRPLPDRRRRRRRRRPAGTDDRSMNGAVERARDRPFPARRLASSSRSAPVAPERAIALVRKIEPFAADDRIGIGEHDVAVVGRRDRGAIGTPGNRLAFGQAIERAPLGGETILRVEPVMDVAPGRSARSAGPGRATGDRPGPVSSSSSASALSIAARATPGARGSPCCPHSTVTA